ncbi:MAG: AAA family ATPase [Pirellulales bacterium]
MRIETLELRAFGPFTDCTVTLCPGMNILYGPNEAGKSSALRAIRSLLYGIHTRSADNFLHPYEKLRLAARLSRRDGQTLECCRRKGQKNTLRDGADDQPLDEGILDGYLGAVNENFFLSVFGIDHQRLRQGGEEIVRGDGKIGELLFSAGGVADLRTRQQEIEDQLNGLFKPGGQKPKINSGVAELHRLRTEVKRLQASADVWSAHQLELSRVVARRAELDDSLRQTRAIRDRLARIQSALPTLSQWRSEFDELSTLQQVPSLPATFAATLHVALRRLHLSQERDVEAKSNLARLSEKLAAETVPLELLAEEETIQGVFAKLAVHRKAMADRVKVLGLFQSSEHTARNILRKMGRSGALENIEQHRVSEDKQAHIQALGNHYQGILEKHRSAKRVHDRLQRNLQEEQAQLSECPTPVDFQGLRQVVAATQSDSRIEEESNEGQLLLQQRTADVELALHKLPLWTGTADELQHLTVPSSETIEHFEELWRTFQTEEAALEARVREVTNELDQLRREQADIEKGEELPSDGDLLLVREERDHGWSLVFAAWQQLPREPEEVRQFVERFQPAGDLAAAFPVSVRRADEIADQLRREADRVAAKLQLEARIASLQEHLDDFSRQRESLAQRRESGQVDWTSRWRSTGLLPLSPREMRGWLRQYDSSVELDNELRHERAWVEGLQSRCSAARLQLGTALLAVNPELPLDATPLVELVDLAQQRLQALQSLAARHQRHTDSLVRLRQELAVAHDDFQDAMGSMAAWKSNWGPCMQQLGLPEEATVEQANSVLANLTELFQAHHEAKGFRVRIDGIDGDARRFTEDVGALAERIAPDLTGQPVEQAAAQLHSRLLQARDIRQRVDALTAQLDEQQQKLTDARAAIAETNAELSALCAEAGCEIVEGLAAVSEKSVRKRDLQARVAGHEKQLRLLSGGHTIVEFSAEAGVEDPDQLQPRVEEFDRTIQKLEQERDELLQTEQHETDELKKMDGNAAAAEQAAECEFLVAQLELDVREYAATRVAASFLSKAIERYRKKAEGPIVTRASEVFATITCGSFSGLRTDFDEAGHPVLLGVRPGDEAVRVGCMSEGACDQLYLALRIATLEHWFEHHEPVPFIVDDVLLSFDNERANAALAALAKLAKQTQIIFFTHHDHLLTIANLATQKILKESEFFLSTDWATR